jgi:protein-S-isoprenylcysteine O-methyltransferase Ste14
MKITYEFLFPAMWLAYMIYWWEMSTNVKVTERRESMPSRLVRSVSIVCAYMLLLLPAIPLPWICERILPFRVMYFWIGSVITAGGLFFSVWARCHLGSNWSQAVTIKENHQLITRGPNAIVRHPIYTGLLLGFVGNALARDEWRWTSCCSSCLQCVMAQTKA